MAIHISSEGRRIKESSRINLSLVYFLLFILAPHGKTDSMMKNKVVTTLYGIAIIFLIVCTSCRYRNKLHINFGSFDPDAFEVYLTGGECGKALVYKEGKYYRIPSEYGENDWVITYDSKGFRRCDFRHFKLNRNHIHKYRFTIFERRDTLYCAAVIRGKDRMSVTIPFSNTAKSILNKDEDTLSLGRYKWVLDVSGFKGLPVYYTPYEDGFLKQYYMTPVMVDSCKKVNLATSLCVFVGSSVCFPFDWDGFEKVSNSITSEGESESRVFKHNGLYYGFHTLSWGKVVFIYSNATEQEKTHIERVINQVKTVVEPI